MSLSICKGRFKVALYDKRNDLSFNDTSYPCLDGNIPKKFIQCCFCIVQFSKINIQVNEFHTNIQCLI